MITTAVFQAASEKDIQNTAVFLLSTQKTTRVWETAVLSIMETCCSLSQTRSH